MGNSKINQIVRIVLLRAWLHEHFHLGQLTSNVPRDYKTVFNHVGFITGQVLADSRTIQDKNNVVMP